MFITGRNSFEMNMEVHDQFLQHINQNRQSLQAIQLVRAWTWVKWMKDCLCFSVFSLFSCFFHNCQKEITASCFSSVALQTSKGVFSISSHSHRRRTLMINFFNLLWSMVLPFFIALHCIGVISVNGDVIFFQHKLASGYSYWSVLTIFSKCADRETTKRTKGYLWTLT